jgi:hypothetical protein
MQLDGYECGMLDTLLEAISATGCLTTKQIRSLFDSDDGLALSLIDILVAERMVIEVGYAQGSQIPLLLNLESKGAKFLQNGGFTNCYRSAMAKESVAVQHKRYFPALFSLAYKLIFG